MLVHSHAWRFDNGKQCKRRSRAAHSVAADRMGGPGGLLMIPWLARLPWTASDFIFAGAMFAIVGGIFELTVRATATLGIGAGAAIGLAAAFLLVWINLRSRNHRR